MHAAGLLQFLAISIYTLVVHDISLASFSSEVSDDSLSRLVACIGCHVSLSTRLQYIPLAGQLAPHDHSTIGWPIGGSGQGVLRVLWNTHVPCIKF